MVSSVAAESGVQQYEAIRVQLFAVNSIQELCDRDKHDGEHEWRSAAIFW